MMATITEHGPRCGVGALCGALRLPRATYYRATRGAAAPTAPAGRRPPARALQPAERQQVLEVLHAPRFLDLAPAQVYATLLDEGTYHCSERTMYRVLAAAHEVQERRAQRQHPHYAAPELLASAPNQLWSWDITKLNGPTAWAWYHLSVILDVFSRYVVGWMVAPRESAVLAERLITASCARQGILRGQLMLHADRGASMTSKPVALLLANLGVTKTHSRPHVSSDNPYSEAHCKRSSTGRISPSALAPSKMPAPIAPTSFSGTTPSTATRVSDSTPRTMCTVVSPMRTARTARPSSPPPTRRRPTDSSTIRPPLRDCLPPPGSTHPNGSCSPPLLSKPSSPGVSKSLTGSVPASRLQPEFVSIRGAQRRNLSLKPSGRLRQVPGDRVGLAIHDAGDACKLTAVTPQLYRLPLPRWQV
jgi:putative transposase